jgi:rare lipoprotein A
MGFSFGTSFGHFARIGAVLACSLALANCGKGPTSNKYGVAASPRMVEPGEPVPKGGGRYSVGKPYVIAGKTYVPEENAQGYSASGIASWYGEDFHGRKTSNGEIFDMHSIAAAHPTLPLPSYVRVTNLKNNRSLIVRVNDRGPFHEGRVIDVSVRAAQLLGFYETGTTRVKLDYVGKASLGGSDDTKLAATLSGPGVSPRQAPVMVASAAPQAPMPQASSKPYMKEFFDPTIANRGALPVQAVRPIEQDAPARRVTTSTEVARAAPQQHAQPAGPILASSRSVPAPAPAPRAVAHVEAPTSFDSRFAPAAHSSVGSIRTEPVSAYAPSSRDGAALMGRGLY